VIEAATTSPHEMLRQVEPIGDLDWLMRKARPIEEVQPLDSNELIERRATEFVEAELVDVEVVEEHGHSDEEGEGDESGPEGEGREDRAEGDRPRRRRRRRGGRRSRRNREDRAPRSADAEDQEAVAEGSDLESETISETVEASLEAAAQDEPGGEETADSETGESETGEPRERKGRRRRRRRGRRKPEGAKGEGAATDESTGEADAELPDEDDDDGMLDTADVPLGLGDDEHDDHLDKNSHRAIPSWEDAIGMIVAVNMEARAKSPRSSGPPRGRGRGRGGRSSNHRGNNGSGGR
jgi:hypothetical protein